MWCRWEDACAFGRQPIASDAAGGDALQVCNLQALAGLSRIQRTGDGMRLTDAGASYSGG